jgi:hypothetical protein
MTAKKLAYLDEDDKVPAGLLPAGSPVVRAFSFAFDTADLETGLTVWTPAVGDVLLDAWFHVSTSFDGTTPFADLNVDGEEWGLFDNYLPVAVPVDGTRHWLALSQAAAIYGARAALWVPDIADTPYTSGQLTQPQQIPGGHFQRFATTDPLKVWVSQDGSNTGDPVGGTQGAATLYFVTVTPAT